MLAKKSLEVVWPMLAEELDKPYMLELAAFIDGRESDGVRVFPNAEDRFNAFSTTPIADVKVVILGQDPYHGADQAHGLSFSVQPYEKIPPSLVNIYKEIEAELGLQIPMHGCSSNVIAMKTVGRASWELRWFSESFYLNNKNKNTAVWGLSGPVT